VAGFTGKEGDEEVGVVYSGERYLIPRLGRWASPDPLHVHGAGGGQVLNSYHYVAGSLLAAQDPTGLELVFADASVRRIAIEEPDGSTSYQHQVMSRATHTVQRDTAAMEGRRNQ